MNFSKSPVSALCTSIYSKFILFLCNLMLWSFGRAITCPNCPMCPKLASDARASILNRMPSSLRFLNCRRFSPTRLQLYHQWKHTKSLWRILYDKYMTKSFTLVHFYAMDLTRCMNKHAHNQHITKHHEKRRVIRYEWFLLISAIHAENIRHLFSISVLTALKQPLLPPHKSGPSVAHHAPSPALSW